MKRIPSLVLLSLLFIAPIKAQTPSYSSSGNINAAGATCGTTNACITLYLLQNIAQVSVSVAGTYTGTLQFEQSADNAVTWSAASPASTSTTGIFTFSISALTTFRVRASAFSSGTANIVINSSTTAAAGGTISGLTSGQVGIAGSATSITSSKAIQGTDTNLLSSGTVSGTAATLCTDANGGATTSGCSTGVIPAGVQKANTISATDYGVLADTQWCTTTTLTSGSGAVTLAAGCPTFVAGDVGKICWATSYTGGTGTYIAYVRRIAQGTISLVTDSTHATCSTTSNGSSSGTFVWGSDDTAGLTAAWSAATSTGICKTLILPTGGMQTSTGQFNTASCGTKIVAGPDKPMSLIGQGMRNSVIIPLPTFDFTHATSCNGAGGTGITGTCFGGLEGLSPRDFSINGMGNCNTSAPAATGIGYVGTDAYWTNIDIDFWGCSDANLSGYSFSNSGVVAYNINSNGGGGIGINTTGTGHATTINMFICCNVNGAIASVPVGGIWSDFGSGIGGKGTTGNNVAINGTVDLYETLGFGNSSSGAVFNVLAGSLYWFGGGCVSMASNESCLAVQNGAKAGISGVNLVAAGTGNPLATASGAAVFDLGGPNTFTGGAGVSIAAGTVYGSDSATGVTLATGNVALTSGWDTSTKGSFSGSSIRGQFTVTLSGTPTSPGVITITYPKAFPLTAPICSMQDVGGTSTTIPSIITTGAVSTTSAAFSVNFTGVPTGTIIFQYSCNVP